MSILLLATDCDSTWILVNELQKEKDFDIGHVVLEQPVPRPQFLKRRVKRLGAATVAGQVAFQVFSRYLHFEARRRRAEILARNGWRIDIPGGLEISRVVSVNDAATIELVARFQPSVVVINGTRILSKRLLRSMAAPVLNMHAGITPQYRGVHGGYWALANDDEANAGVTVHMVDPGIDTGDVLYQDQISREEVDNFTTYPLLQLESGIPLMRRALRDALAEQLRPKSGQGRSKLFFHPTLWQYLVTRAKSGVR